jgi:hypothetical protein
VPEPARHVALRELWRCFPSTHLPPLLQLSSAPGAALAEEMVGLLPASRALTVGLRKLLEAKDGLVRAALLAREEGSGATAPAQPENHPHCPGA